MESVKLKIAEAIQDDVNKGIVRIDSSFMHEIDVRPGDIVEIKGERTSVGIIDRAYPGDIGLNIIRMDGIVRRNTRCGLGDFVEIKKCDVKEAKKVIISPASKGVMIKASSALFKQGLLGRAMVKGDLVSLGGSRKRKNALSHNPFFDDVFHMLDENLVSFGLGELKFIVADTSPQEPVVVTDMTEVVFNPEPIEMKEQSYLEVTYEDIGGLSDEVKKVREMVELPLKHPELFERLGIEPPKGVLLHGPPGTGKTLLAKAVANETNANFILINGPEIMSKYYGQSEMNLRKKFEQAEKNAPSIIFIDEIDAIAVKREESHGEVERRVVAQLLAIMDGLKSRGKVVVIAASNIPNSLDPALRRPGRFDREIEIGVPDKRSRENILQIHTRNMPLYPEYNLHDLLEFIKLETDVLNKDVLSLNNMQNPNLQRQVENKQTELQILTKLKENLVKLASQQFNEAMTKNESQVFTQKDKAKIFELLRKNMIQKFAEVTHGFVGADLSSLCKEAAMTVLRRLLPDLKLNEEEKIPQHILEKLQIKNNDFLEAIKVVRPSAMREVLIELPNVTWKSVGGLQDVKKELVEAVDWPIKHPDAFSRIGIKAPRGILLYGPPGTGKTLLAKAVATESKANFIVVKGPEMLSKWLGESEKAVRKIFEKARQASPCIIFFDEIDAIAPGRGMNGDNKVAERVVNQLLTEIDGLQDLQDIVVMGSTNRPDMLDTALLRPGRFDRIIYTPVPDKHGREEIFKVCTKDMPLSDDISISDLAEKTPGYVGADINLLCKEAGVFALRENIDIQTVSMKHFEMAFQKVSSSVTKEVEESYKGMYEQFRKAKGKEMKLDKPSYYG